MNAEPTSTKDSPEQQSGPPASLRRELSAIAVLYLILSILPLLIGLAFAP